MTFNTRNGAVMAPRLQHDYHDYSVVPDEALGTTAEAAIGSVQMANAQPSFPVKVHHMLEQVEKEGLDDIVGWEVHGRCFKIHDHNAFVEKILPRFFRQTKYASFQRQLNLYEFRRLTIGQDRGAYYHEMFLRGRPGLAFRMKRTKYKGKGPRRPASPQSEPNFYHMPPVPRNQDEESTEALQSFLVDNSKPAPSQMVPYQQQSMDRQPSSTLLPTPSLSHSSSGCAVLGASSRYSPSSITDNVSTLLDELLRNSSGATPSSNVNNNINSNNLNLAEFLAGQYRNRDGSIRREAPGFNQGMGFNIFSA